MKLSITQMPFVEEVKNPEAIEAAKPSKAADKTIGKASVTGKTATTAAAQHKKARRDLRPRPQHATLLDTTDDDNYDDCWLPEYEDPRPTDKVVDNDWVSVKKPASGR
ncbi:uncharacterized protein ColSpa_03008 [Colletotrichum spaethianum]|uniref:Uncharacterized protein n=1 Tax=Colletotrichum spaethianum TaxID=700344 RepID=A0AA37L6N4_9PEZI|nr:uncharacterized protein ColSpa_03008 [Colletotrichum spaethianum]GKT42827.1 hypothetical protein ColSpa_03008 [Colletotrichum spaethianum]